MTRPLHSLTLSVLALAVAACGDIKVSADNNCTTAAECRVGEMCQVGVCVVDPGKADAVADSGGDAVAPDVAPDAEIAPDTTKDAETAPDATPDAEIAPDATPDAEIAPDTTSDAGCTTDAHCKTPGPCEGAGTCEKTTGVCTYAPLDCSGLDTPCGVGVCAAGGSGGCVVTAANEGAGCDVGDACSTDDTCTSGTCVGKAKDCDDAIACTADSCVGGACVNDISGCDCTVDGDCDDDNDCTTETCASNVCKTSILNGAGCDDGSACSSGDTCTSAGACVGQAVNCDDANPCTSDQCNPQTGACTNKAVADGNPCAYGLACTKGGACQAGACGCACPDDARVVLTVGQGGSQFVGSLNGLVTVNPDGTATDGDISPSQPNGKPYPTVGPLSCASEWATSNGALDQLSAPAVPQVIRWKRECVGTDGMSQRYQAFLDAGKDPWVASQKGSLEIGALALYDGSGTLTESVTLSSLAVTGLDPAPGKCVDFETLTITANWPLGKRIDVEIQGLGTVHAASIELTVSGTKLPVATSLTDWAPYWTPSAWPGSGAATLKITSPCGDAATNAAYGWSELSSWATLGTGNSVGASLIFRDPKGGEGARLNLYDSTMTSGGTCAGGKRTAIIAVGKAEQS